MKDNGSSGEIDYPVLLVFLIQLVIFLLFANFRFIAFDEGFYALASKQVASGRLPYLDFFYPQMPLLPFVYGGWVKLLGCNWQSTRVLSVLLTAVVGTLVFIRCRNALQEKMPFGAVVLFVFSGMTVAWFVTIKTYALTIFLLFVSYLFLCAACQKKSSWSWFLAGLFLGLAVQVRLMMLVLVLVYLYLAISRRSTEQYLRFQVLPLFAGLVVAAFPAIYFLLQDFDLFWFNNLGYHLIRRSLDAGESLGQKLEMVQVILGLAANKEYSSLQLLFLLFFALLYWIVCRTKRKKVDPALLIATGILLVSFVPSPCWAQYFSVLVPFLVVVSLLAFRELFSLRLSDKKKKLYSAVAVCLVVAYLVDGFLEIYRHTASGERVLTVEIKSREESRLASIEAVSDLIDHHLEPGGKVLSIWPGYLFASGAEPVAGMENQFWFRVQGKLDPPQIRKYKLMSTEKLRSLIVERQPQLVVYEGRKKYFSKRFLNQSGYRQVGKTAGVMIFKKDDDQVQQKILKPSHFNLFAALFPFSGYSPESQAG